MTATDAFDPATAPAATAEPRGASRLWARYRQTAALAPRLKGWRAYTNLLRGYIEYCRGTATVRARPVKLIFDPTNACQLGCPLCPTGRGLIDRRIGHAELDLFRSLLDQVGDYVFLIDLYNWGDPLLNPRLEAFIALAAARGIVTTVSSNLSLRLTDERIARLLTSGVGEIIISLDGVTAASHEYYRRKSNFALISANMRRLVAVRRRLGLRTPLLTWQFVVFSFNEHEIAAARAMAEEIGVDRITFRPPFLNTDRYDMPASERAELASWVPANRDFHVHTPGAVARRRCGWHYTASAINADGTVTPCSTAFRMADDFGTLGRRGEHRFAEVANNPAFRTARTALAAGDTAHAASDTAAVLCQRCPTPSIQTYHRHVYRRIAMLTGVALAAAAWRMLGHPGRLLRGMFPAKKDGA